jgi:16S rRNA (guanine527-N7)-methyltransferase
MAFHSDDPDAAEALPPEQEPGAAEPSPDSLPDSSAEELPPKEPEEDPPGPDLPAPPLDEIRDAMQWAFADQEVEAELLDTFSEHARLVLEGNRKVNMTAILDPKELAVKHYLDSWRVAQFLPMFGHTVLDIGTGAGFPGIPIAITEPMARVTVLDSTRKKTDFVQTSVDALGLKNVEVHWGRAEDWLLTNRADIVLFRAVSSIRENVRTLRKGRHAINDVVMLKGKSWSREVRAAEREVERLGFSLDTVWEHSLPDGMGERAILLYRAPNSQGGQ